MKSKNRSISKPVASPKVVTNDAENLSARNISFVVQGQIQPETYTFLQALRRNFPEAELVLSTWRGQIRSVLSPHIGQDDLLQGSGGGGLQLLPGSGTVE